MFPVAASPEGKQQAADLSEGLVEVLTELIRRGGDGELNLPEDSVDVGGMYSGA